ncbi:MAG: CPBP family intramembrane glutamic endopeptidase [Tunicatimonas sp.]
MNPTEVQPPFRETKSSVFTSLLLLVAFVFVGLFVGQFLGFLLLLPLFDLDFQRVMQAVADPAGTPNARAAVLVLQAGGALFGFVLTPLLHQYFIDRTDLPALFTTQRTAGLPLALVGVLVLAFMPVNSLVMEWNLNLDFGPISPAFHEWAYTKEEQLRELTEQLTRFESVGGLLAGMAVIAVLPAVGEELVFRGIVQRRLYPLVRNPHVAIWIAALVFSAIHVQFFGFFPRLLLGALFGYLYYWSGNLWYPIFAHFVNNGFTLLMLYLYQQGSVEMDIESIETVSWSVALVSLIGSAALLYFFKQQTNLPAAHG